jgi:hypothetical protein
MPSEEKYLDDLLKGIDPDKQQDETLDEKPKEQETGQTKEEMSAADMSSVDDISGMSEDEIMELLSASEEAAKGFSKQDSAQEKASDVLDIQAGAGDDDLMAIQDLLEKADENLPVDKEVESLLKSDGEEDKNLEEKILSAETAEGGDGDLEKEAGTSEKKLTIREKIQKLKEKKAEKKAKKQAGKEAGDGRNLENAENSAAKESGSASESTADTTAGESGGTASSVEDLVNTAQLDSIVALASDGKDAPAADSQPEGAKQAESDGQAQKQEQPKTEEATVESAAPSAPAVPIESAVSSAPAAPAESEAPAPEKKGLLSKLLSFLTEEEEEEKMGNENIHLSDENQEILDEMDKEAKSDSKKDKKKPNKKADKGKGKKETKKKKEVKKKPPKPKKEKKPKEEKDPGPKLPFKKVLPILLLALTLGVFLVVSVNSLSDYTVKREAKTAFYAGDYETCYQNLYGKELTESETVMYSKSESILYIRLWLREYEILAEEGEEMKALDSLIQTVDSYPELYEYALQWNAGSEVAEGYQQILDILSGKYGLTEEQAKAIAEEPSDLEYTKMIAAIVDGKAYGSWNETEETQETEVLQDELPEESELGTETFK